MSYWIEIRCESRMGTTGCYSAIGYDTPMTLTANNSQLAITNALFRLSEEAKKLRWKEIDKQWVCPKCQEQN